MTTNNKILTHIKNGFTDSRMLAREMDMSQEYIRRVVKLLANEGKVNIIKAPRGYTYEVV
ncbi:MAG: hypothetical protein ACT6FG_00195 [Methanosarcinaceae archaeon]